MSGLALLLNNTNEPLDAKISLPISEENFEGFFCVSSYIDGTSSDASKIGKNYASDKNDATIHGAPVVTQQSTRFKGLTNYLETDIQDSADFTFFGIIKSDATQADNENRAFYIGPNNGNVQGGTVAAWGVGLVAVSASGITLQCGRGNSISDQVTGSVSLSGYNHNAWSLVWGRCNGLVTELHDVTQNLHTVQTFTLPRLLQQRPVYIGSGKANSGECDVFRAAWFNRALSDDEIKKMVDLLRLHALSRGITV